MEKWVYVTYTPHTPTYTFLAQVAPFRAECRTKSGKFGPQFDLSKNLEMSSRHVYGIKLESPPSRDIHHQKRKPRCDKSQGGFAPLTRAPINQPSYLGTNSHVLPCFDLGPFTSRTSTPSDTSK